MALTTTPTPAARAAVAFDARELKIMRQSALERALIAFGLAGINPVENRDELVELSQQYLEYFVTGRIEE